MRQLFSKFHIQNFLRRRDGTAAVEFAIVMPVMLLLLFGGSEIGRLLIDYHAITKSVRDATRFLTRVGLTCPGAVPVSGPISNYIDSASNETIARNLAISGSVDNPTGPSDYLLKYWTNANAISITVNCIANAGQYSGVYISKPLIPQITMSANVPFALLTGAAFLNISSLTMSVQHTQVHVGQ
jgi:hypothetical protein